MAAPKYRLYVDRRTGRYVILEARSGTPVRFLEEETLDLIVALLRRGGGRSLRALACWIARRVAPAMPASMRHMLPLMEAVARGRASDRLLESVARHFQGVTLLAERSGATASALLTGYACLQPDPLDSLIEALRYALLTPRLLPGHSPWLLTEAEVRQELRRRLAALQAN